MTLPTTTDAKNLIDLAERMGIPTDAAIRQVEQLITEPVRQSEPDTSAPTIPGALVPNYSNMCGVRAARTCP